VVGTLADPLTLDPHAATDLVSAAVVSSVCEPLVRIRADGARPEAALATTWATRDSRVWTFTLRRGVRFHDGTAFDADAVVRNIERLRRVRGFPGRGERLGPHSVAIALERPSAALLATLSQPFFAMQSPAALDDAKVPVGTGAFRYGGTRPGEVELVASPEHWAGPPRLSGLLFRRFAGQDALLQALAAGEVDVTGVLGQDRVEAVRQAPGLALDSKTGVNLAFLSLNNERAPLSDRRVRQALARAIDRPALVREVLGGHGEPARNPLPPSLPGYFSEAKELRLDPVATRQLLSEAGLEAGFDTTLLAVDTPRPYLPHPMRVIERIQGDLARVGIRARLVPTAGWNDYVARVTRGDYDLAVLGWQADSTDANDFLAALLGSESIGATNRSRYASEEMDALLKRGRRLAGPEQRAAAYKDAQRLFRRDMPIVPLYHVSVFTAYGKGVHGLQHGPTGLLRFDKAWKAQ
jgi:ABC-type transport system substrate-binding protein